MLLEYVPGACHSSVLDRSPRFSLLIKVSVCNDWLYQMFLFQSESVLYSFFLTIYFSHIRSPCTSPSKNVALRPTLEAREAWQSTSVGGRERVFTTSAAATPAHTRTRPDPATTRVSEYSVSVVPGVSPPPAGCGNTMKQAAPAMNVCTADTGTKRRRR